MVLVHVHVIFRVQRSHGRRCTDQGVQRRMVVVVNFFVFLKLLLIALLLIYVT